MSNTVAASKEHHSSRTPVFPISERIHKVQQPRERPLRLKVHAALRWLHIYSSLVSLTVVLLFAATGVTLNHPEWLATERTDERTGNLPSSWRTANGVDWMVVSEYLRNNNGVHGTVADRTEDEKQAALTFRAPGYQAVAFIDSHSGSYTLTISSQGFVGVINDLHRGRDAGKAWGWLIDVAGFCLVFLSLVGLGLLFYLKKVRVKGLVTLAVGTAVLAVLAGIVTT